MEKLFYELVKAAIGKQKCLTSMPSAQEWLALFDMAQEQALVGVCFAAVKKLQTQGQAPTNEVYYQWLATAGSIQSRNEQMNSRCMVLNKRLSADGLRPCILKGQGVAILYPQELRLLRQPGDIDAWVDGGREAVIDYVMGISPTKEFDQKHIHFRVFNDTDVELHWKPVELDNTRQMRVLNRYFALEKERQFGNSAAFFGETMLCVPTRDFQLVHQLLHVYRHYLYEGVGLRQLMDCHFTLLACTAEERRRAMSVMNEMKMPRFVAAVMWVQAEVFGLEEKYWLVQPDEREGRRMLKAIEEEGNFGHASDSNHPANETAQGRMLRRMKRKLRLFRYDALGTLLFPFERVKLEAWMRRVRKQYNV